MEIRNEHPRRVFVGYRVIFQVTHPRITDENTEADTKALIVTEINRFLDTKEDEQQENVNYWRDRLDRLNEGSRIVIFSVPEGEAESFSLIPVTFREEIHAKDDPAQDDVIILLNDAYTELGGLFPIVLKKGEGEEEGQDIVLKSISPDWLASDLHHGGNTGGPGSMPATKLVPQNNQNKFELKGNKNGTLASLLPHKPEASGEGVEVVILDTAIPFDSGVYITVATTDGQEIKDHVEFPPEIKVMLAGIENHPDYPGYPYMEIFPYPYQNELKNYDPLATWPYHYEMPDHGTFIASIIRAISPSVKIYLYEVLNRFGVGSLISIAEGVVNAINRRNNQVIPVLVINCSFMLDHELDVFLKDGFQKYLGEAALKALQELLPQRPEQKEKKERNQELLELSMRDVFRLVTIDSLNIVVVAAAGNDGPFDDGHREPPHYPAAFANVLSVSALPKGNRRYPKAKETDSESVKQNSLKYRPSTYSNLANADDPNKKAFSFATFGGDLVNESSKPVGGVLGVYIGGIPAQKDDGTFNFKPGPTNTTGWAQWSGTSFATPIISALLAAKESELSYGNDNIPPTDRPVITGRPYRTEGDENVILLRQGE